MATKATLPTNSFGTYLVVKAHMLLIRGLLMVVLIVKYVILKTSLI